MKATSSCGSRISIGPHRPVSAGFTPGSRDVTFYDPDGIPHEYYYMNASYADVYGVDVDAP